MLIKIDSDTELEDLKLDFSNEIFLLIEKNRKNLKQFLNWLDFIKNINDEENFIKSQNKEFINNFVIKYKNKIIGVIDLHDKEVFTGSKNNKNVEDKLNKIKDELDIGYWIDPEFEGKGIVTKSCKNVIKYAFDELNLNKIFLHCDVENIKSENIAKRLNFSFVKEIKNHYERYGNYFDAKEFVLTKKDIVPL